MDYDAATTAAAPWSTPMSSAYDEGKSLPFDDCNLTSLYVYRVFCMIRFLDGAVAYRYYDGAVKISGYLDGDLCPA